MVKNLRNFFVALLATMSFNTVAAQDVIWQEDWSDWSGYVKTVLDDINENYTFTGTVTKDDGSFSSGTTIYNEKLAGGEAPELLVAKNGGTFSAVVDLDGRSGDMTLTFKTNRNDMTVEVAGATLGDKVREGNDCTYPLTVAAGTSSITITFKMETTSNGRLDNIRLFQGQGKKAAGLSWGTSARTVTIGADDNLFPTLTNGNNLPIVYTSSETTVATIDAEGVITLVAAGKTVIAAEFVGNDEYEAAKVEYTLTVKDEGTQPEEPTVKEVNVAQALEVINALEDGKTTTEEYKVTGFVVTVTEISTQHGNATFTIADAKGGADVLTVYRAKDAEGNNITDENLLKADDEVVVQGKLQKYVKNDETTPEVATGGKILTVNGQSTTNINAMKLNKAFEGAIYNMAGQVVTNSYKGLVIMNGRKYVNK